MDLDRVPEIPSADADRLRAAGIGSAGALAATEDVDAVARRTGLSAKTVDAYRGAARRAMEKAFVDAGIGHEADLAAAEPQALAAATGLPLHEVESFQAVARASIQRTFAGLGITTQAHLAAADPRKLAEMTGMPLHHAERYVAMAQEPGHPAAAEPDPLTPEDRLARAGVFTESDLARVDDVESLAYATGIPIEELAARRDAARRRANDLAAHPEGEDRIVLEDGVSAARVRFGPETFEGVRLVTGRFEDDAEDALTRAGEHGVFLLPGATTAKVRIRGRVHAGFPIYKAQPDGILRVRVKDVREKGAAAPGPQPEEPRKEKGGLLGRFMKRKP